MESEKAKCIKELEDEEVKKKNSEEILREKVAKRDQVVMDVQDVEKKCKKKER